MKAARARRRRREGEPLAAGGGDVHVAKILADDRTNSLVIVATERAYLRILEIIKRLDVPQTGEGEIHVLPLQHADAVELDQDAERDHHRRGAGGGRGATGRRRRSRAARRRRAIFEARRQGQRRQGDELDRRHVVACATMRSSAPSSTSSTWPRRQVFIEAVDHGSHGRPLEPVRRQLPRGDTHPVRRARRRLALRRLEPAQDDLPARPDAPPGRSRSASAARASPGAENLLGTGITIPAFGVADQRPREHGRRRHPLDAAHPGDRQHPRRDQRRPEHPAADERRRSRLGGLASAAGATGGDRRARRARRARLRRRRGAAPGRRHEDQDHAAPERVRTRCASS